MPVKKISTMLTFLVAPVLALTIPTFCFALEEIEFVTKERAKELGLVIEWNAAGPDAVRVVLDFETKGELKNYTRVELSMHEGEKLLMSSTLKEEDAKPGHVVVSFAADRKKLNQIELKVVVGQLDGRVGHIIPVKDFVDLEKAR